MPDRLRLNSYREATLMELSTSSWAKQGDKNSPFSGFLQVFWGFLRSFQTVSPPPRLASVLGLEYIQFDDVKVSDEQIAFFDSIDEKGLWPNTTLTFAGTILSRFQGHVIISGDICDQVGKYGLHQNVPESLANPSYFQTKIHNTDNRVRKHIQDWIDDVRTSDEKVSIMDLFAIESRVGRWANETNMIYCNLGLVCLNIFNSRRIISHIRDCRETYRSALNHLLFPVRTSRLVRTFLCIPTVREHPKPHLLRSLQAQLLPNEHEGPLLFVKFRI